MQSLVLPWPPNVNNYWRNVRGRTLLSERGREYRRAAAVALLPRNPAWPFQGPLEVELIACQPNRLRRDLDNLPKAVLDALRHSGVMVDDSQIHRLVMEWGPFVQGGEVRLTLRPYQPRPETQG